MNKKGFMLYDALICIFVSICICTICATVYKAILNYDKGYENYNERINDELRIIYQELESCEGCIINESD